MSKYTTGEIAKLCGVSVRTVQYYDTRGLLVPSELSEGGRRLYSEDDVRRLKVICFLRGLDLPINRIGELLAEEDPDSVIDILLAQQEQLLREEIDQRQEKLQTLTRMRRDLRRVENFSVESIGDIAQIMENRKKLRRTRIVMISVCLAAGVPEWATIIYQICTGTWQPFVLWMLVAIPVYTWITRYYFKSVAYICPQCHTVFRPSVKEALFAHHTPNTRKLHCSNCGHHGFCVEIAAEKK